MDKLEEIRLAILEGQKNAALLLPALDLQTGETDISAIEEELINNGVPEEEVKDNTESIRDYVEKHRDEVSSVAALTQRVCLFLLVRGLGSIKAYCSYLRF